MYCLKNLHIKQNKNQFSINWVTFVGAGNREPDTTRVSWTTER